MNGYKQKYENLKNAYNRLRTGLLEYDEANELQRDGLIQRFEFTFELAWKTLKAIFEDEGLNGLNSPKTVLREAFSAGLIEDEELWLLMLHDRNSTTHVYDEKLASEICEHIREKYMDAFDHLIRQIDVRKFN